MKIWVLMEDTALPGFAREHGLSLYIETGNTHILFDMGASPAFLHNAARLGLEPARVDFAVLSHGHDDHGGGLPAFLASNTRARVYLRREALRPHWGSRGRDISLRLPADPRLVQLSGGLELAPGIRICPGAGLRYPASPWVMEEEREGRRIPDPFDHEQYLLIEESGLRYLFTGCAHRGVKNIAAQYRPDVLVGGFHLLRQEGSELADTVGFLAALPTRYAAGHCTGQPQLEALQAGLPGRVQVLTAGAVLHYP